jgi:hypothetical protein
MELFTGSADCNQHDRSASNCGEEKNQVTHKMQWRKGYQPSIASRSQRSYPSAAIVRSAPED